VRIGVDATCWANPRGYGRFTRELLPEMVALAPNDTFVCLMDERAARAFDLNAPNIERRVVALDHSPTTAAAADGNRSPIDMLRLTWATATARLDVFFSPSVYTFFPLPPGLRAVITVHDAIADRFPELTLPSWRARTFWRAKIQLALLQARIVMTVSEYASSELQAVLGVRRDRIRVALEAPAAAYTAALTSRQVDDAIARHGLADEPAWFVYVGGFNPHKHIDVLVKAHAALVRDLGARAPVLLLVGATSSDVFHSDQSRIARLIDDEGTAGRVRWLGFVADDDLRAIHTRALALVLPSASEGFGLPAVEAAACGAPVIATTASPLPDLLAGGGLFVTPGCVDVLTDALRTMATDRDAQRAMGRVARTRAAELTWAGGARAALGALREAV
jgi:glycosyltransferase involved in cell wall biosynthesis